MVLAVNIFYNDIHSPTILIVPLLWATQTTMIPRFAALKDPATIVSLSKLEADLRVILIAHPHRHRWTH